MQPAKLKRLGVLAKAEEGWAQGAPISSQDDFVAVLRRRMTCLDLDHKAGFHDGYTAHLENPHARSGRNSLRLNPMAQLWLDALGLQLMLGPKSPFEGGEVPRL